MPVAPLADVGIMKIRRDWQQLRIMVAIDGSWYLTRMPVIGWDNRDSESRCSSQAKP